MILMTNEELAQAIEVTDARVKLCGTGQPRYEVLLLHLKCLLLEQKRRAEAREEKRPLSVMKVFTAIGYEMGYDIHYPEFQANATVVANTREEALGLLLEAYPTSSARYWVLAEVDYTKVGVTSHDD